MKKSLVFISLSFAGALLFASPKGGKVQLKVWESQGPESEFIHYAIKEYRKVNPKVKVTYEAVSATDSRAKLELDGPAGVGADIFVSPHDHIGALVAGGHVIPVEDSEKYLDSFYDMAKVASSYNGLAYGYPLAAETYALFYNKNIIKVPPKSWEEIITFAKTFNVKSENKFALVWSVADAYFDYMFLDSFGAPLFGPNGDNYKQHNLNSPAAIKSMKYFQKLRSLIFDIPASDATSDMCDAQFISGKAAMIITGPWKIADYKKNNVNFGIAPLPGFNGIAEHSSSFSGVRLAFVSAYSEHPEEAKEFAKFITSKAMLEKRFEITNQISPRKDIVVNDEHLNGIKSQLAYAKPMPVIPQLGIYWSAMGAAYAGIWSGDDVKTALDAAAATMEAAQ
ncbi:MAG: maltose ABC transporter substrate-binding protein [Treponema sp.]|nr:maltose ABC transporter substrate-binding protein [Treponema sp.]